MANLPNAAERLVTSVRARLREEKRSVAWLASEIGANPSTVRYQLARPSALSFANGYAIATRLGLPMGDAA